MGGWEGAGGGSGGGRQWLSWWWQCHVVVCVELPFCHMGSGSVVGMTAVSLVAVGGVAKSQVVQLSIVDNIG